MKLKKEEVVIGHSYYNNNTSQLFYNWYTNINTTLLRLHFLFTASTDLYNYYSFFKMNFSKPPNAGFN